MQKEIIPCPTCGQNIGKRVVHFAKCLASAAYKAFVEADRLKCNVVAIKSLKLTTSEYARMNDLVRFGLLYREDYMENGYYGVAKERIAKFFTGQATVPEFYIVDPVKKTVDLSHTRITIYQTPNTQDLIEMYGKKFSSYLPTSLFD